MTTKLTHVGELILELDNWMQDSIQRQIEFGIDTTGATKAFENARNILARQFPKALEEWGDILNTY